MQCPTCGSNHLQRFAVLRAQGTAHVDAEHVGLNGPFVARSHATMYSDLARRCAPPAPPSPMGFLVAVVAGTFVTYKCVVSYGFVVWKGLWIGLGLLAISFMLLVAYRQAARDYGQAKRQWLRSWLCMSCGQACISND